MSVGNSPSDGFQVVFRPKPEDVPEIMRKAALVHGQPFVFLPDRPDAHKVLAIIDGVKIRREGIEMVFNDTVLMDFNYSHCGVDSDSHDAPGSPMRQIRALARELYGEYGKWVAENFGKNCLECHKALPEHTQECDAGKKWMEAEFKRHRAGNDPTIDRKPN